MPTTWRKQTRRILALASVSLLAAACTKNEAPRATIPNDVGADGGTDGGEDDVAPVYPIEADAPAIPAAEQLCAALSELPEKKRAACCRAAPGVVVTAECTRMLSAALRHRAVALSEAAVAACVAAFEQTLAGCDWVGPFPPAPPAACRGILEGRLGAGQKCRSSLECTEGLRCLGAGPTTAGACGPPKAIGELCGGTVDTLAGYTRQSDVDAHHPECNGRCIDHRCASPAGDGAACRTTADCSDGLQCLAAKPGSSQKKCTARPLPKPGEACPGGVCEGGLPCIKGTCAARKPAGEACTSDFECRGGCLKGDGGERGTCGPRCDLR